MLQKEYMTEVLDYIEHNLNQPIYIQEIPISKYLSTMQLYRDFYNITGHSVKEYIRKRRLSNALGMVKNSDRSLIDIAYDYGYSSQQAFCKCVKSATGLTPMEYKLSDACFYYPKFCFENKYQVTVITENIPQTLHMKYYHSQLRGIENRAVSCLISLLPNYEGRIFGRNGEQQKNKFCYELNIEYKDELLELLINSAFTDINVMAARTELLAKICIKNIETDVISGWNYLCLDWLKVSMFEQSEQSYFEEYIYKRNRIKRLLLYLPVKKRNDYHKIYIRECEDMNFLVSRCGGVDGEERASKTVLEYLFSHDSLSLNHVDNFYVASQDDVFTCGVMIHKSFDIQKDSPIEQLHIESGSYVILEGDCCGNSSVYEQILNSWMIDYGVIRDKEASFTIYETKGSFDIKDIKTMVYCKLG